MSTPIDALSPNTLHANLLPLLDKLRGIPVILGLRPHTIKVRTRTWSGGQVGLGTPTDTNSNIRVDLAVGFPKIRNLTQKEIIASGGLYRDQDLLVGPITPPYPGSAIDKGAVAIFDPPTSTSPTEVFFLITGPGYPATGDWFKKIGQRTDQPFRYMLYLRKTGIQMV